jgi:hypothetical protein
MIDTLHVPLSAATRLCAELDAGENADTPETNAAERMAYSHEHMVPTDFARKLERHRDTAREKYCEALTENMLHVSTIARLEREKDEVRAWVSEIFRLLDLPDGDMGALENFIGQRDEWARLCGQYKQERDEARSQRNALAASLEYIASAGLTARHCEDEAKKMLALVFEKEAAK